MTADGSPAAVFELCDAVTTGPEPHLLGLWTTVPSGITVRKTSAGAVAFGPPGETTEEAAGETTDRAPVWRANFPSNPDEIAMHLGEARRKLDVSQGALVVTPARLDALVARGPASLAYAFSTPGTGLGQAEEELSLLLAVTQGGEPTLSYGLGDQFVERWAKAIQMWKEARQAFQAFAVRLQQMISHFALVETRVAGDLVGWTCVTWTGDTNTILADHAEPGQMRLHQHTLNMALESRRMLLRTSTLVIANAAKLSLQLATGGGLVMFVPAVLRFINQVRTELKSR